MTAIIDTYARPSAAALTMPGVVGASRYLSHDSGKNCTRGDVDFIHEYGKVVQLNFEDSATNAMHGAVQGAADGTFAVRAAKGLDAPAGVAIYASADFSYRATYWTAELGYFAAFAKVVRQAGYRMGGYGDRITVGRLLDAGAIDYAWQTAAWSNGEIEPRAVLYQDGFAPSYDMDEIRHPDFGAWTSHGPQVAPVKPAAPVVKEDDMTPAQEAKLDLIIHALGLVEVGDSQNAAEGKIVQGHPDNLYQMHQAIVAIGAKLGVKVA